MHTAHIFRLTQIGSAACECGPLEKGQVLFDTVEGSRGGQEFVFYEKRRPETFFGSGNRGAKTFLASRKGGLDFFFEVKKWGLILFLKPEMWGQGFFLTLKKWGRILFLTREIGGWILLLVRENPQNPAVPHNFWAVPNKLVYDY